MLAAVPAFADTVPERARALAAEGRAAYDSADYQKAIAAFTEANALAPSPGLLFNLAQSYRLSGNCDDAALMYRRYLATNPNPDAREIAEGHLATSERCSRKVALAIPLDAKERAATPGAKPKPLALGTTSTTKQAETASPPGVTKQRVGMGLMIGGGLALAAATYFSIDAHSAQSDVEDAYLDMKPGSEIVPIDERGKRSEKLGVWFGIGGGVLVVGGVVTYMLGRKAERASAFAVTPAKSGGQVSYAWQF